MNAIDLLNEVFGRWHKDRFDMANFNADEVDLSFIGVSIECSTLNDHQKYVLKMRYLKGHTLKAIGKTLHVTQNRVRQIQCRGVRLMRSKGNIHLLQSAISSASAFYRK